MGLQSPASRGGKGGRAGPGAAQSIHACVHMAQHARVGTQQRQVATPSRAQVVHTVTLKEGHTVTRENASHTRAHMHIHTYMRGDRAQREVRIWSSRPIGRAGKHAIGTGPRAKDQGRGPRTRAEGQGPSNGHGNTPSASTFTSSTHERANTHAVRALTPPLPPLSPPRQLRQPPLARSPCVAHACK